MTTLVEQCEKIADEILRCIEVFCHLPTLPHTEGYAQFFWLRVTPQPTRAAYWVELRIRYGEIDPGYGMPRATVLALDFPVSSVISYDDRHRYASLIAQTVRDQCLAMISTRATTIAPLGDVDDPPSA